MTIDEAQRGIPMNDISELIGKVMVKVEQVGSERLEFHCEDGTVYAFFYERDCCASCDIEDIIGNLSDLVGSPILMAEEVTSDENPEGVTKEDQISFTWTFYKFATVKGYVTVRWYGESNGYYSESVSFKKVQA